MPGSGRGFFDRESCSGWSHWSHHTGEKFRNVKTSYYERWLSNRDFHLKGYYEALISEEEISNNGCGRNF